MTYAEAVARLLALRGGEHAGMRPGLERVHALLDALGHPEQRYGLVQVGGTNGKGSAAAMLAAILRAAGRRVGLYTSPNLVSFRERIRINGEAIPEDGVVDGVESLGTLVARLDVSMFEATTVLALDHFARESVDVAVLEVGLGGRLDATTVGMPMATVLTRIDLDHEAVLGHTLAAIAGEKAAIIRSGRAFAAAQAPEAARVLVDRAAATGIPLDMEGRELSVEPVRHALEGQRITCAGPGWRLADLDLALLGRHQHSNALVAVAAARAVGAPAEAIRAGLRRVHWPGRFEVLGHGPWTVLDGAHNPAGARALAVTLRDYFGAVPVTFVVGVLADKDHRGILAELVPLAGRLVLTRPGSPRAADPRLLAAALPPGGPPVEIVESVDAALVAAERPPRASVVCVAGSLMLIGDVLRRLRGDIPCPVEKAAASMGPHV
jgi:dihydrofolate synthase/folylpolyglutamate synthase